MDEEELEKILEESRKRNKTSAITGMLIYVEGQFISKITREASRSLTGRFIQVLEGEESAVKKLYELIVKDCRHIDLIILKEETIQRRNFKNWEMGYRKTTLEKLRHSHEFVDLEKILEPTFTENINEPLAFLKSFYHMSKKKL